MGTKDGLQTICLDEARLQQTVEALLTKRLGYPAKIHRLRRAPNRFTTLFPAEVLSVDLENGSKISLFLKHLGQEESDHPEKQCRDREVRIYEELLGADGLPVPRCYGSRRNEETGRHELFLEYVDDWNLRYHAIEHWITAARHLARLHTHFAGRIGMLSDCDFLLRFNRDYFHEWADRARFSVIEQSVELAAELQRVTDNYDRAVDILSRQPLTLVHNDLSPKNAIADTSSNPARICFVDWEVAGIGCGFIDLARLKYGLAPEKDKKMRDAYCSELAGTNLLPSSDGELTRVLAASELVNVVHRLARSKIWGTPSGKVAGWVQQAQIDFSRI